ncbi:zinc ribbon domain-containing protein [Selenomonas sp.]|uniref:zinc ribbon domain-containing protein n=1 Tax=Selenomonas sp. TaxID=2053611 RepID=UPI0025DAEEE8|nr:zinc ribbon domain-containing protein [Selenomonas sp.]MBQ1866876.1 zinc ribbon domain-containing protein [Selenomonas sp.]
MFCKNCNTQLPDNATFCKNCGARVTPEPAAQTPAQQPAQQAAQPAVQPTQTMGASQQPNGMTMPPNAQLGMQGGYYQQPQSRSSTVKIVAITLGVVAVLGLGFMAVHNSSSANDVPQPAQTEPAEKGKDKPAVETPQAGVLSLKHKDRKLINNETNELILMLKDAQITMDAAGHPQLCLLYTNKMAKGFSSIELSVRALDQAGEPMKSPVTGRDFQSVEAKQLVAPGGSTTASDIIPLAELPKAEKYKVTFRCINFQDYDFLMFKGSSKPTVLVE